MSTSLIPPKGAANVSGAATDERTKTTMETANSGISSIAAPWSFGDITRGFVQAWTRTRFRSIVTPAQAVTASIWVHS